VAGGVCCLLPSSRSSVNLNDAVLPINSLRFQNSRRNPIILTVKRQWSSVSKLWSVRHAPGNGLEIVGDQFFLFYQISEKKDLIKRSWC
jgi:hypothetical protein